jgi:hypothetical protein
VKRRKGQYKKRRKGRKMSRMRRVSGIKNKK